MQTTNARITATPSRRRPSPLEAHLPRHIRHDAPEMVAAQAVLARVARGFIAHGINSPIHAPGVSELADIIARALGTDDPVLTAPSAPAPLTDAEADDLIGN